jgi:hypothetical protein
MRPMPELLENFVVLGAVLVATVIAGLAILGRVRPFRRHED